MGTISVSNISEAELFADNINSGGEQIMVAEAGSRRKGIAKEALMIMLLYGMEQLVSHLTIWGDFENFCFSFL